VARTEWILVDPISRFACLIDNPRRRRRARIAARGLEK
jgi:hypothetical protein